MTRVAVIGASGYTGIELLHWLHQHPQVEVAYLAGDSSAGKEIAELYPHLQQIYNLTVESVNPSLIAEAAEVAFLAMPSGHANGILPSLIQEGMKVIDLGGDLRLPPDQYENWYQKQPVAAAIQQQAVYGLPEWYAEPIKTAGLIANPGCYPTATLLGLLPLVEADAIELDSIIIDAKSGVSGAGRSLGLGSLFSEVNENFKAYKVNQHQHTPEIELQLSRVAGLPVTVTFTPHLVPMTRGILVTSYAKLKSGWEQSRIYDLYKTIYETKPFVRIRPLNQFPQTKEVAHSNYCDVGLSVDQRTGRITVISAIDNLVKGASGQAIQNLNLMMGFTETEGLRSAPTYP